MPYTYHDFEEQATPALKLARLELHLSEVNLQIGPDVTDGEVSVNRGQLINYRKDLMRRREELEQRVARGRNRGPVYLEKVRPGSALR